MNAQYEGTLSMRQADEPVNVLDTAREQMITLTTEHYEENHTIKKLEQEGQLMVAECQQLLAEVSTLSNPQTAERLRVVEYKVGCMKEFPPKRKGVMHPTPAGSHSLSEE